MYMGRYGVVGHLTAEDLDVGVGKLGKSTVVLKRLYFVRYLCRGMGCLRVLLRWWGGLLRRLGMTG